jgi:hypothetical protein
MGNPVHQHYIPKSYLKYFGEKKGDNYFVDTVMADGQIKQLTTTNICVQKNIYTFALNTPGDRFALEKFYAVEVDGVYPKVYDILVNPNITVIGEDDKRKILNTILSLYFRTPHFLNDRNESFDRALDQLKKLSDDPEKDASIKWPDGRVRKFKMKDIEEVRAEIRAKHKEEFLIAHFADWQEFVKYKMTCGIEVITVPDDIPLITSDNPLSISDLQGRINPNVFHRDNIIEFPINRNQYVIIMPNSIAEGEQRRIIRGNRDKYFAVGVNRSTERNSRIRLIGYPGDLKTHFEAQAQLNDLSNPDNILSTQPALQEKTRLMMELLAIRKKTGTFACQEVADKVKEIRKTGLMNDDMQFERIIQHLAINGFLTV